MRGRRVTLGQVKRQLDLTSASIQAQINKLEEMYFLEIDELADDEDEPQWVIELSQKIDALKTDLSKVGKSTKSVESAIMEAQFHSALKSVFNFLMSHLK